MFARFVGAAMRGFSVAVLVAAPSLLLPSHAVGSAEVIVLLALLAGGLTFAEYSSTYPSIVEFRDAPPLNRMRFIALSVMVLSLTLILKHRYEPSNLTELFAGLGYLATGAIDFPYSPVRLMVLTLPPDSSAYMLASVRVTAGVSYLIALVTVGAFVFHVRALNWPLANGAFNVWINLPLFDPTTGGDVVRRLQRDGRVNTILGILLPFLIPAVVKAGSDIVDPLALTNPHTLVWTMAAWAFLPASMIMRGTAMLRVAELIAAKRQRAYANAETAQIV